MDTNLKIEAVPTEDEARANYAKALSAFNAKCAAVDALRQELEEESTILVQFKAEVDKHAAAFLRAVERDTFDPKTPEDDAADKAESRTIGKIMGKTEDAPAVVAFENPEDEAAIAQETVADPEIAGQKYPENSAVMDLAPDPLLYAAKPDVTEADRDEDALAIPSPGARRAESISNVQELSQEAEDAAEDVLTAVDNILAKD